MKRSQFERKHRRGLAAVEWFCILGLGTIAIIAGVTSLGHLADGRLSESANYFGDPASITHPAGHEGEGSGDGEEGGEGEGQTDERQKGNNGVGNGEDGQPPGDPPINDGPGTGPGNPGNRGGAHQ